MRGHLKNIKEKNITRDGIDYDTAECKHCGERFEKESDKTHWKHWRTDENSNIEEHISVAHKIVI